MNAHPSLLLAILIIFVMAGCVREPYPQLASDPNSIVLHYDEQRIELDIEDQPARVTGPFGQTWNGSMLTFQVPRSAVGSDASILVNVTYRLDASQRLVGFQDPFDGFVRFDDRDPWETAPLADRAVLTALALRGQVAVTSIPQLVEGEVDGECSWQAVGGRGVEACIGDDGVHMVRDKPWFGNVGTITLESQPPFPIRWSRAIPDAMPKLPTIPAYVSDAGGVELRFPLLAATPAERDMADRMAQGIATMPDFAPFATMQPGADVVAASWSIEPSISLAELRRDDYYVVAAHDQATLSGWLQTFEARGHLATASTGQSSLDGGGSHLPEAVVTLDEAQAFHGLAKAHYEGWIVLAYDDQYQALWLVVDACEAEEPEYWLLDMENGGIVVAGKPSPWNGSCSYNYPIL